MYLCGFCDEGESDIQKIHKIEVLPEILAHQRVSKDPPLMVVKNRWKNTGLCNEKDALTEDITEDSYSGMSSHHEAMQSCIDRISYTHARIETLSAIKFERKNEFIKAITDGNMEKRVIERTES